jgi:putative ABC transport system ATP-binding protein
VRPDQATVAAGSAGDGAGLMVAAAGVSRTFGSGPVEVHALREVSFSVPAGHLVALRGRSGSGKTSLLNIVGGLDLPTTGSVHVAGQEVTAMSERERLNLRRRTVSFIFQSFGLIPMLSAAENIGIPLRISRMDAKAREERVALMLAVVGQLDSETGRQIMRLLRTVVRSEGITALVATHDAALMDLADDVLQLEDGQIAPS